jgi:predicted nuclease of predicted toxin-antitoxin system
MKLLFDHHLSRKLVRRLEDLFPGSSHVGFHNMSGAADVDIWAFAAREGYAIVTKDSDFNDLSALRGAPPKVIWVRIGNCTTAEVESILRGHAYSIEQFLSHATEAILEIILLTTPEP